MARDPYTHDCAIRGCTRAQFKGELCRKHYDMAPADMKRSAAVEAMMAAHKVAQKWHRRQLAYVRRLVASGQAQ